MKIYLIVSFFLAFLFGCTSLETPKTSLILDMKEMGDMAVFYKSPVIIDTTNLDTIGIEDKQPPYVYYRQIMYAGINKDTIYLPDTNSIATEEAKWEIKKMGEKTLFSLINKKITYFKDSLNIWMFIDTSRITYQKFEKFHVIDVDNPTNIVSKNREYYIGKNYPLVIYNNTLDTLTWMDVLPIAIEAKDKEGTWQIIQKTTGSTCGNGRDILISFPKKQILIVPIPIYKGNFTTKLRVRLGKNVSNEYTGQINLEQFEKTQY